MIIPNLSEPFLAADGKVNPNFVLMMQQMITYLQTNLSNEGYKMPQQNASTIIQLNTPESMGATLYNNTTHKLMINENGVFKTVTTT